jgi:hypothetical protein
MGSKNVARLLPMVLVAILAAAFLAPIAQAATPKPGYTQFAGCPSPEENPNVTLCARTVIKSGHFQMGSKDVPITNPMVLSGGQDVSTGKFVFNSKGGLTAVKQKVPGGVVGLTGLTWLLELLGSEALTLYAVTELAGPLTSVLVDPTELPIKVHLINSTLGNNCYVGSNSNPIRLQLTTKTTSPPPPNTPITGKEPVPSFDPALGILHFDNGEYVDNAFAAPGATGCVLTLFGFIPISINGLVNAQSGLPAAAGTNETRQVFDLEATSIAAVYGP